MTTWMVSTMIVLLLLGFPMMIPLIGATMLGFFVFFSGMKPEIMIQQMIGGIKPTALIAVPMFIFAADIVTKGHAADRLLDPVERGTPDQHERSVHSVDRTGLDIWGGVGTEFPRCV